MRLYLRNKTNGEIRDVEADSDEFRGLIKEVTPGGLSMWEQTNFPHADAVQQRAAEHALRDEDLGTEHQNDLRYAALRLDLEGVAPESNPHLALTPGEIEAGLTPRDKLKDLQDMYDSNRLGTRAEVFDRAADRISDGREVNDATRQPARGQSARAGGSDEREGVPSVEHRDEDEGGSGDATVVGDTHGTGDKTASPRTAGGSGSKSGSGDSSGSGSGTPATAGATAGQGGGAA